MHTIKQYNRHILLFARWMAKFSHRGEIEDITHEHIASFFTSSVAIYRADSGIRKATSMNALKSSIKGFFEYLHNADYIPQVPTWLIRRAICGTPLPRSLNDDERERLLDALLQGKSMESRRDHALFALMLFSGIRLSPTLALDVRDVDLDQGVIWLKGSKGNREEKIYLIDRIWDHLKEFIDDRTSGPLFMNRSGKHLSSRHVQRRFSMWLKKAQINRPLSPHSCRHTFARWFYGKTHDLFLLNQAMGHRSILSTMVYLKVDDDQLRKALYS